MSNQRDANEREARDDLTARTDVSFEAAGLGAPRFGSAHTDAARTGTAHVSAAAERATARAGLAAERMSRIAAATGGTGAVGGAAGRKVCVGGVELDAETGSVDGASGSEADVVPGLKVAELVMLAGVEQGYDPELPGDKPHTTLLLARELAYCYRRDTIRIYGNVAHATHGETRTEILGSGDAGSPAQVFTLRQSPLTYVSAPTPDGIESTLRVRVGDVLWHETDSHAGSGPKDRAYVTKTNDEDATTITFGNGREGARPATGVENVRAVYRTGLGKGGNVVAGQISMVLTKPLGVKEVTNPLAATGGAGREERDQMRRNAPLVVTSLDRLVSTRDYEDFARTFAGIGKASAARLSDGRRQLVHLTIAGEDDIPIAVNSDLYKNLRAALGRYGDPSQPVQIATRHLKLLFVAAKVRVQPDYLWESVEPKIRAAMLERFGFNRRDLGQDVVLSEVTATVQSIEGVAYADVNTLDEVAGDASVEELLQIYLGLGLKPRIRARLARVDRAATDPAKRILPAQLATLSPLVPEMLNLTELKG
ncbi:MAG: putative baseplate assembly protein [Acidobacteria bacterium]|nr:putative baseplate assembly protein [Acidobacteriota bacterium]